MLHDVELVIHDPALRQPLLDALPERLPHVHTGRPDRAPLKGAQLLLEELVQRLLSSVPARTTTALVAQSSPDCCLPCPRKKKQATTTTKPTPQMCSG
jgi:hypothetical protein